MGIAGGLRLSHNTPIALLPVGTGHCRRLSCMGKAGIARKVEGPKVPSTEPWGRTSPQSCFCSVVETGAGGTGSRTGGIVIDSLELGCTARDLQRRAVCS